MAHRGAAGSAPPLPTAETVRGHHRPWHVAAYLVAQAGASGMSAAVTEAA